MGMFFILSLSVLFLSIRVVARSFLFGYGFWLFSSSSALSIPQQLCPHSSPKYSVFSFSIPLQLFPHVPRTLFWLLVPLPHPQQLFSSAPRSLWPLLNGASLSFPGLCPPPWLGARMLSPLILLQSQPLPSAPSLASAHLQQLAPSPHCTFGFGPSPPPARPLQAALITLPRPHACAVCLEPHFPVLSSCSLGTCPCVVLSPVPPSPGPQQLLLTPSGQVSGGPFLPCRPCSPPGPRLCSFSSRQLSPLVPGLCVRLRLQAPYPAFPFCPMPASTGAPSQGTGAGKWRGSGSTEFLTSRFITVTAHHSGDNRVVRMASRNNCK